MHPMQGAVRLLHSYCLTRRCPVPSALKNTTFSVLTSLFKKCQTNLMNPTWSLDLQIIGHDLHFFKKMGLKDSIIETALKAPNANDKHKHGARKPIFSIYAEGCSGSSWWPIHPLKKTAGVIESSFHVGWGTHQPINQPDIHGRYFFRWQMTKFLYTSPRPFDIFCWIQSHNPRIPWSDHEFQGCKITAPTWTLPFDPSVAESLLLVNDAILKRMVNLHINLQFISS